nr:MAG TPA: hypothetical protein [Caudoviricetes sp.]
MYKTTRVTLYSLYKQFPFYYSSLLPYIYFELNL